MSSDRTHPLRKRIAQLKLELRAVRQQAKTQRQRIAQKCGHKFLALVDSDRNCKVVVIDIVQKLVVEDEEGHIVSETDGSLVGKLIEVKFNSLHQESYEDSLLMSRFELKYPELAMYSTLYGI